MYYSDKPINSGEGDLLGRRSFAKLLAQSLINLRTSDTFSIGLFGKWGSGKTSVVNMMIHELETLQSDTKANEQIVVVHFEPWNFATTDQLLSQFFIRLSTEFKSKNDQNLSKIADAIDKYSDAFELAEVIPYVGRTTSALIPKLMKSFAQKLKKGDDEKDIQKRKEYIINLLRQQTKRVLVVIDDIDRLSSEQIRLMFQLIASVAKFPNTMYLLVFDKDIIVSALKNVQEGGGENYLEKIIQIPIQIPDIKKEKIRNILISKLNESISEYPDISFQQRRWQKLFGYCIEPFIHTLRDVNRLCNSVQFKITAISSDVNFIDMVSISAIEIALPNVYEWVKNNKAVLTGEVALSTIRLQNKTQKELFDEYSHILKTLLNDDSEVIEIAIEALSNLFPHFGYMIGKGYEVYDDKQLRRDNCIAHADKFDRYFCLDLSDDEIRKSDVFNAVFSLDCEKFKEYLLNLDSEGKCYDFLEEMNALISKMPADRAKNIIIALLSIAEELNNSTGGLLAIPARTYAEHMIIDLLDVLETPDRLPLLESEINTADLFSLSSIASVINMLELGYGRLAANGEQYGYKKVVSMEELIQLERSFTEKAKQMLESSSLFDFSDWRMIHYLLECFDSNYINAYLAEALKDEKNIAFFIAKFITVWVGHGTEYEVRDDYTKYMNEEQITQSIELLKSNGELFQLPEEIQNKCGAYYLKKVKKSELTNCYERIPQEEVDKLLGLWKTKTY